MDYNMLSAWYRFYARVNERAFERVSGMVLKTSEQKRYQALNML